MAKLSLQQISLLSVMACQGFVYELIQARSPGKARRQEDGKITPHHLTHAELAQHVKNHAIELLGTTALQCASLCWHCARLQHHFPQSHAL